jgi:hypothetical protein
MVVDRDSVAAGDDVWAHGERVVDAVPPNADGWYVVYVRYDSGGGLVPFDTYRSRVSGG